MKQAKVRKIMEKTILRHDVSFVYFFQIENYHQTFIFQYSKELLFLLIFLFFVGSHRNDVDPTIGRLENQGNERETGRIFCKFFAALTIAYGH